MFQHDIWWILIPFRWLSIWWEALQNDVKFRDTKLLETSNLTGLIQLKIRATDTVLHEHIECSPKMQNSHQLVCRISTIYAQLEKLESSTREWPSTRQTAFWMRCTSVTSMLTSIRSWCYKVKFNIARQPLTSSSLVALDMSTFALKYKRCTIA